MTEAESTRRALEVQALKKGERTGRGIEGAACPSCGMLLRIPHASSACRIACPCGAAFEYGSLSAPPQDRGAPSEPGRMKGQTLLVFRGQGEQPEGEGAKAAAQAPDEAPTMLAPPSQTGPGKPPAAGIPGATSAESPEAAAGMKRIGKYEIIEEIARGGMGVVYRARQEGLNREVALKMLLAGEGASEDQIRRFMREAESAAALSHPNIVRIFDVGSDRGRHYYAMEFIHGESVAQVIRRMSVIPPRQALKIIRDVAHALDFAHEHGIVHRDVKPANIMLSPTKEQGPLKADKPGDSVVFSSGASTSFQVLVTDFGLAKDMGEGTVLTVSGTALGTPVYMSPEQADGDLKNMGPRSDVYSMGAVLYEMVTGKEPFTGASIGQVLAKVISEEPVPPRKLTPGLHRDIETIILTAMAKDRGRRYATAKAFAGDIERFLAGEHITARPASLVHRIGKKVRRNKVLSASVLIVAAVLAAAIAWMRIDAVEREKTLNGRAMALVAEAREMVSKKEYLEAEKTYVQALALIEGFDPAVSGLRDAKLARMLGNAHELLKDENYKAAGFVLQEALSLAPGDPAVAKLARLQTGISTLEIRASEPELVAYAAPAEHGIILIRETAPAPSAGVKAGLYERLGSLPYGPIDRPFGDIYLVLARGDEVVDSFFLRIHRSTSVLIDRKVIRVDPSGSKGYKSIQRALNDAGPGSLVEVADGRYEENLWIGKPGITLRAVPGASPEIGSGPEGPRITATGSGIRIEGFRMAIEKGTCISIGQVPGVVLVGTSCVGGTAPCFHLSDCSYGVAWGNEVTGAKEPGIMGGGDYFILAANRVSDSGWAGILSGGYRAIVARNISDGNSRAGIFTNNAKDMRIFENVARRNMQWGILVAENTENVEVRGNLVTDSAHPDGKPQAEGIAIKRSKDSIASHNTICRNVIGLAINESPNSPGIDNIIFENRLGLHWHTAGRVDYNCIFGNRIFAQWIEKIVSNIRELQAVYTWIDEGEKKMAHGIETDPKFRDPANGDFGLAEGSPCIGTASDGGDMGVDWEEIKGVLDRKFNPGRWISRQIALRCIDLSEEIEKDGGPGKAASLMRKALALAPEEKALAKRLSGLEIKAAVSGGSGK